MLFKLKHKSFAALLGSGLAGQLCSILTYSILALIASSEQLGEFSTAISISAISTALLSLGFNQAILASATKDVAARIFTAYQILVTVISVTLFLFALLLTHILPASIFLRLGYSTHACLLIVVIVFLQCINLSISTLLQRLKHLKIISLIQLIGSVTFCISILFLLAITGHLASSRILLSFFALSQLIQLITGAFSLYSFSIGTTQPSIDTISIIQSLRDKKQFILYGAPVPLINTVSIESPQIILALFYGQTAAGVYALSLKVLSLSSSAISSAISKYYYSMILDIADARIQTSRIFTLVTLVLTPFTFYIALSVPNLLNLFRPNDWEMLKYFLLILCLPTALWSISQPFTCWYLFRKVPHKQLYWNVSNLLLRSSSIVLSYFLMPANQIFGIIVFSISCTAMYGFKLYTTLRLAKIQLYTVREGVLFLLFAPVILFLLSMVSNTTSVLAGDYSALFVLTTILGIYYTVLIRKMHLAQLLGGIQAKT